MEPLLNLTDTPQPLTSRPTSDDNFYEILCLAGDRRNFDRVTHVLDDTKSKAGLNVWYAIEARKQVTEILNLCSTIEEARLKMAALGQQAAEEIRDAKADDGKAVHAMIERYLTGSNIPEDIVITAEAVKRFNRFLEWAKGHTIERVAGYEMAEHTVHSEPLLVAGTLDMHLLVDGKEKIIDTKTGKGIYRDAAIQVSMYALMEREGRARDAGDTETLVKFEQFYNSLDCPPIDWPELSILHIPEEGITEYAINPAEAESYVRCFLSRLRAFRCDGVSKPFRRVWPKEETRWLRLK